MHVFKFPLLVWLFGFAPFFEWSLVSIASLQFATTCSIKLSIKFFFYFTILGWVKTLAFQAKFFNFAFLNFNHANL